MGFSECKSRFIKDLAKEIGDLDANNIVSVSSGLVVEKNDDMNMLLEEINIRIMRSDLLAGFYGEDGCDGDGGGGGMGGHDRAGRSNDGENGGGGGFDNLYQ